MMKVAVVLNVDTLLVVGLLLGSDFQTAQFFVFLQSLFDFDVDAVREAGDDGATLVGLLAALTVNNVDEGGVAAEGDGSLGDGKHLLGFGQYDLGGGAVTAADVSCGSVGCGWYGNGGFDLELIDSAGFGCLRADIFQTGFEACVLQGTDGYLHRHPHGEAAHLGLVDVAAEDEVGHVGYGGDSCTVVEGVAEDYGVTDLDGDVEDAAADGAADEGVGRGGVGGGDAVANDL